MTKKDFLLEIGCEELPPKLLQHYAEALLTHIISQLNSARVLYEGEAKWLAAPRRLAVMINGLALKIPAQPFERTGPAVNAAYDKDGNPTPALLGFVKSCQTQLSQLEKAVVNGVEKMCYKTMLPEKAVRDVLPELVAQAIKNIPIAKPMRWSNSHIEFIRPVHWVLMLLGDDVVAADILGKKTDRLTYGHRFLSPAARSIISPTHYTTELEKSRVIVDFDERRNRIKNDVEQAAKNIHGHAVIDESLLDEVTAIVEWPAVLTAQFDQRFLQVPQEALMSAMQQHQKSFPVVSVYGEKILPYFIFVSNIESKDPQAVINGNERVMRARLSDAAFFYETDLKTPLAGHLDALKNVVFQAGLGSLFDRSERIAKLAEYFAQQIGENSDHAYRAGLLAKCDLMTTMVGEFPELQGTMGYYYAAKSGEQTEVAKAIKEQYKPAFANDSLPKNLLGHCIALADKIDTLVGIFGINQKPSGTKDPFGLRRAAIGIVRILQTFGKSDLRQLLQFAEANYLAKLPNKKTVDDAYDYVIDRLKSWSIEQGFTVNLFNTVAALKINNLNDFVIRLKILQNFLKNSACEKLSAANKRVVNILSKESITKFNKIESALLKESAEKNLYAAIMQKQTEIQALQTKQDYAVILDSLSELQDAIDSFFNEVMVNTDDLEIKQNRICLLENLRILLNSVADLSYL